jgi:multiple sugar transport system ATP-binding protein
VARIRFENVTKYYGNVLAVDGLNLEIRDREFVVLLGPSGCGKTTTLNMIAGLEELSGGDIWFDEQIVNFMPPHVRDVAMVFQSYALYPHKSVYENIAFGLVMRRYPSEEIDRRVRDAAARLHIEHLLERRPNQLSGGQRQRVALGRAMVRQPAVFLMDEPLSNLDAALRLTLADRIVVMKDGVVQQLGTPEQVYEQPRNTFVASFLGNPPINYLEGELVTAGRSMAFRRGGLTLALGERASARLAGDAGREIVLGIRPEDVDDRATPVGDGLIDGHVTVVMPIGSDQYLSMKLEGLELFFRVGKESRHRSGEEVTLAANLDRLHVFDPHTAESLLTD